MEEISGKLRTESRKPAGHMKQENSRVGRHSEQRIESKCDKWLNWTTHRPSQRSMPLLPSLDGEENHSGNLLLTWAEILLTSKDVREVISQRESSQEGTLALIDSSPQDGRTREHA